MALLDKKMQIFGWEISKKLDKQDDTKAVNIPQIIEQDTDEDTAIVTTGGRYGMYYDVSGSGIDNASEGQLVQKYREAAEHMELENAINDIVDEAIASLDHGPSVNLILDDLPYTDAVKTKIEREFKNIVKLMEFTEKGTDLFRQWYVDGKLYIHLGIDHDNPKDGIAEFTVVDPRKIKRVKEVKEEKDTATGIVTKIVVDEYFIYTGNAQDQRSSSTTSGVKLAKDSVICITSGKKSPDGKKIESHLHKSLKFLNQLRSMEDALVIYRLARAPERRIFYIDTGNLPKGKAEEYMRTVMSKYKNKIVYDAQTGAVTDERKHMCLSMDTKVPLLDGRTLTLTEITNEFNSGKTLWAYSCDPETGEFKPGLISWSGVTRENTDVLRLTLDSGKTITCTPDHKFPVWNKGLVRADQLAIGESMVPHYTRKAKLGTVTNRYQQFFDNVNKKWTYTHRAVSKWKDSHNLPNEFYYDQLYKDSIKGAIHHVDINPLNNAPENLVKMDSKDHFKMHGVIGTAGGKIGGQKVKKLKLGYFDTSNPEYTNWKIKGGKAGGLAASQSGACLKNYELGRKVLAERMLDPEWNAWFRAQQSKGWTEDKREIASKQAKEFNLSQKGNSAKKLAFKDKNSNVSIKHRTLYKTEYSKEMLDFVYNCAQQQLSSKDVLLAINANTALVSAFSELNSNKVMSKQKDYTSFNGGDLFRISQELGANSYPALKSKLKHNNHKIVNIEYLSDTIDTGCLTIDGHEVFHDYHTFALDAGIYTQNSMMEDYWLPRREGGRGTEIDTLPGGENLGQIDDIEYFRRQLYKSLNIPVSRLEPQEQFTAGRSTEITRDEVKFQKFINRLRKQFSKLFFDALRIQLQLKGVVKESDWDDIKEHLRVDFVQDNHFYELLEYEILQDRLRVLSDIDPLVGKYFSHDWVQKNILKLSKTDIDEQQRQIATEKEDGAFKPDEDSGRRY